MGRYLSVSQCLRGILTYPMLAWDTNLPNACVGRQAFPMNVMGRQGVLPMKRRGVFLRDVSQMRTNMIAVNANAVGFCILQ